jgi:hypothetical protein
MTVYVTQELKGRDLSSALEFGELQVVVPANVEITPENMNEVFAIVLARMGEFNHRHDYLLLSGDPVVMGIVWQYATEEIGVGTLRVLRWDRIDSRYIQFDV